jgi:hypothetical protein
LKRQKTAVRVYGANLNGPVPVHTHTGLSWQIRAVTVQNCTKTSVCMATYSVTSAKLTIALTFSKIGQ